ncbi:unnamed protein product, partial [Iphiclides podalirius]
MPRKSDLKCYFGCIIDGPLHRFPIWTYPYEEKFNAWKAVLSVKTQGNENRYIYNNVRFCYRHFEKCFQLPSKLLTRNAVPTLYLENQAKEKRKSLRTVCVRNSKPATRESSRKKNYLSDAVEGAIPHIKTETPSASSPNPEEQDGEDNEPKDADQNASPEPPTSSPRIPRSSTPQSDPNRRISSVSPKKKYRRDSNKGAGEMFGVYTKSKMRKKIDDEESTNIKANKMFLLSLLPAMNCMTPTQIRSFKRVVIELKDRLLNLPPDR